MQAQKAIPQRGGGEKTACKNPPPALQYPGCLPNVHSCLVSPTRFEIKDSLGFDIVAFPFLKVNLPW
jgi:hypothetical protein